MVKHPHPTPPPQNNKIDTSIEIDYKEEAVMLHALVQYSNTSLKRNLLYDLVQKNSKKKKTRLKVYNKTIR